MCGSFMIGVNTHGGHHPLCLAFIAMFYFDLYVFNQCIFHLQPFKCFYFNLETGALTYTHYPAI